MKEKLLLVGAGGFGRIVLEHAMQEFDCAFVDDGWETGKTVCGALVVGHVSDLTLLFDEYQKLVVTVGNNVFREKIYAQAAHIGYSFPNIICKSAYISQFARLGTGCVILNNVVVQNGASVGNGALLNPGVEIHADAAVGDYALIYANSVVRTGASVGNRVRIGSNVTVGNRAKAADDSDIADGAVLREG